MGTRAILVTMAGYPLTPSAFMPDNGLAQLAACLLEDGHDVEVHDLNTPELVERLFPEPLCREARPAIEARLGGEPLSPSALASLERLEQLLEAHRDETFTALGHELAAKVQRERAGFVGFKLWNGDGYTGSVAMAQALKQKLPDLPTIAGGPQVDFFHELLPRLDTGFDTLGIGEGEPTVRAFARCAEGNGSLADVPNLLGRDGRIATRLERIAHLDALPLPVYDEAVYPAAAGPDKLRAGVFEESRGCPFCCAFCNHPLKAGSMLRTKSIEHARAELRGLQARYGFGAFKLGGSFTPSAWLRRFARALLDDGGQVALCAYGRISDARPDDFARYRAAGVRALFFGVETGSQALIDDIGKGYQAPKAVEVLRACSAAGIRAVASLVYPNPGETEDTRRATLAMLAAARPDAVPIHFPVLLPGSDWWASPERFGFEVPDRDAYLRASVGYKARLLFPPSFWPSLPYRIDGKPFATFAAETAAMTAEVEALGCVTLLSDEAAMLAGVLDLPLDTFRDRFRRLAATGDAAGIAGLVKDLNRGLAACSRPSVGAAIA